MALASVLLDRFRRFPSSKEIKKAALIQHLQSILPALSDGELRTFIRLFGQNYEAQTEEKLCSAIDLVHRTIAKKRESSPDQESC